MCRVMSSDHCSSRLPIQGCHRNTCGLMSFCAGLDVEREAHKERKTRRGATLPDREEKRKWITQDTRRHQPPEPVPFIVHNTSLFTLHSKSVHVVYSNQLIATEALDKGLQNKKKRDFCRLVSNPFHQIQKGEGKRKEARYTH